MPEIIAPTARMAVWVVCLSCGVILALRLWDTCRWRFWVSRDGTTMFGRFLMVVGFGTREIFWWLAWLVIIRGDIAASMWFRNNIELTYPSLVLVLVGAALSVGPETAPVVGRWWPVLAVTTLAAIITASFAVSLAAGG